MKMLKNNDGDVLTSSSPRADSSASNTVTHQRSTTGQQASTATTSLIINNLRLGAAAALSPKARMIAKWKQADCVCFDVDSTVCMNEAIDDLAYFVGVGAEVERMTKQAMNGNVSFRDALRNRLNIIRPSEKIVRDFVQHCAQSNFNLTPRVDELVEMLHSRRCHVYLVSGGFRLFINPVADQLGIDRQRIYANKILFDTENGDDEANYAGFCEQEMTSESGGKGRVIEHLKATHGYRTVIMIGDGATDLESYPPADGFIGFGGNVCREKVKQNSDWFVYSFAELIDQLK